MRNLVKFSLLSSVIVAIGCGSQVVEFAEPVPDTDANVDVVPPTPDTGTPVLVVGVEGSDSSAPDSTTPPVCVDANCPVGQVCVNDTCTPVDPCDGVSCPEGTVCQEGSCVSTDPCSQVVCPEGSVCTQGQCVSTDPCENVVCNEGFVCKDGNCVSTDPCFGVVCPESRVCKDGTCVCQGDPPPPPPGEDECGNGKTLICHLPPGNRDNMHTLCVGTPSVPAHLRKGDKLGPCPACH